MVVYILDIDSVTLGQKNMLLICVALLICVFLIFHKSICSLNLCQQYLKSLNAKGSIAFLQ